MRILLLNGFAMAAFGVAAIGCQNRQPAPAVADTHGEHKHGDHDHGEHGQGDEAIHKALAKLSPEDRKLAEEQGYCANEPDSPLGSMGLPVKLTMKGRPVFVCCDSCSKDILKNPEKALATVDQLRAKVTAAKK